MNLIDIILIILFLVLVIVVAAAFWPRASPLFIGGGAGAVSSTTNSTMALLDYYVDDFGHQPVVSYLEKFYDYKPTAIRRLKPRGATDEEYLRALVSDIIKREKIGDEVDFIGRSGLRYSVLAPDAIRRILDQAARLKIAPREREFRALRSHFREMISGAGSDLTGSNGELDLFLKYNRLFKFCDHDAVLRRPPTRLTPSQFTIDVVGLLPRLRGFIETISKLCPSRSSRSASRTPLSREEKIRLITRYLDDLMIADRSSVYELEQLIGSRIARDLQNKRDRDERQRAEGELAQERERNRQREIERQRERDQERIKDSDRQLKDEFYKKIQEDPELVGVAEAVGMTLDELFEQYKSEKAMSGGGESAGGPSADEILQRLKTKLREELNS
jgi:hypothetical protein